MLDDGGMGEENAVSVQLSKGKSRFVSQVHNYAFGPHSFVIPQHPPPILSGSSSSSSLLPNTSYPASAQRITQHWLDKSTIHIYPRWALFCFSLFLFFLRVYYIQAYFIVAYGLGIYLLNNFIAFLSPLEDPMDIDGTGDMSLPTSGQEAKEFRPFARRLPEFKFWLACFRGTWYALLMTFFSMFDIPVFWPILLLYFIMLFFMTMKRQIMHMYKHRYVPITWGKFKPKGAGFEKGGGGMQGQKRAE